MSDPRLNSCHLDFPRRQQYRRSREALRGARGLLTLAAECVNDWVGDSEQGAVRPDHVLAGARYLLIDHRAGCAYPLKVGLSTLGRLPDNDIRLEELSVSRRHCVILVHARGGGELHDTASRNGTWVNGLRVERPVKLVSGDCIGVCQRRLLFVSALDYQAECGSDEHPATIAE